MNMKRIRALLQNSNNLKPLEYTKIIVKKDANIHHGACPRNMDTVNVSLKQKSEQ